MKHIFHMLHSFCCTKKIIFQGLLICFSLMVACTPAARNIQHKPEGPAVSRIPEDSPAYDSLPQQEPAPPPALSDNSKKKQKELRSQVFYRKLKKSLSKSRLGRKIFDLLFVSPQTENPGTAPDSVIAQQLSKKFEPYQEQVVGQIQIRKLEPFGENINDTTQKARSWLQKNLNRLHFSTRSSVIRNNILIEPGDKANPFRLADSERVLRQLPFVRDARVHLIPRSPGSDTVDVLVLVQDVFAYTAGGSFQGFDKASLELNNHNLAGFGHELYNELIYEQELDPMIGYRGIYNIPNIYGSFISSSLEYASTDLEKTRGASLQRSFFTPEIKWAGGLQYYRTEIEENLLFRNKELDSIFDYRYHSSEAWVARAFPLRPKGDKVRSGIVLAGRYSETDFRKRPPVQAEENHFFHDQRQYFGSIGWSRRHFQRDRYLFGFGRTEDVPLGTLINLTLGLEEREFTSYRYLGLSMGNGRYIENFGYLFGQFQAGSFFQRNGRENRRQLHVSSSYYSPLLEAGSFTFRQILSLDYLYGDHRFGHEFLRIGENNIRGFHSWKQRGTQRFSLRFETISFTPLSILDFQFAGYAFADISFLNNRTEMSLQGSNFQGYGLGIRIRNDHLTFDTFQIRFSFYPDIPEKSFGISISTLTGRFLQNFLIEKPQPLPFR